MTPPDEPMPTRPRARAATALAKEEQSILPKWAGATAPEERVKLAGFVKELLP